MKLINADTLRQEIKSNADLGQWDAQEVIKIIESYPEISVSTLSTKPGDIIVVNFHDIFPEDMEIIMHKLKQLFPNNEVLGVDDVNISSQHLEDVIEDLENTIKRLKGDASFNRLQKGEWVPFNSYYRKCNKCERLVKFDYADPEHGNWFNFCPNCGADMRGGSE